MPSMLTDWRVWNVVERTKQTLDCFKTVRVCLFFFSLLLVRWRFIDWFKWIFLFVVMPLLLLLFLIKKKWLNLTTIHRRLKQQSFHSSPISYAWNVWFILCKLDYFLYSLQNEWFIPMMSQGVFLIFQESRFEWDR